MGKLKHQNSFNEAGMKLGQDKLDNEENLYQSATNFDQKHLQQFYTPKAFSQFLANCLPVALNKNAQIGSVIIDPTAGDGSLIEPFMTNPKNVCIGIEIDKNNVPKDYPDNADFINADFVKLSEYFKELKLRIPVWVMNPPFSLKWTEKEIDSQLFCLRYAEEEMFSFGVGYMICLKSFADKIMTSKKYEYEKYLTVARINVKNLFKNASVEVSVLFFAHENRNSDINEYNLDYMNTTDEQLDEIATAIRFQYIDYARVSNTREANDKLWNDILGCADQYKRDRAKNIYDIGMKGNAIQLNLTNYKWYKLEHGKTDVYENVKMIHRKSPNYLAFNTKVKLDVFALIEDEFLTISPKAKELIETACAQSEFIITPFKALNPQQRLGYLTDHTKIKCIKSFTREIEDESITFNAGTRYDLHTQTKVTDVKYQKPTIVKGKEQVRNFSKTLKALEIKIADKLILNETPEDINFLVDHFEIPNPKDIATKFPAQHKALEERLRSDEFTQFSLRQYQIYDLSRIGLKDQLILSWDQGLGKTRAGLIWAQIKNTKKCLIVAPQDIIGQWQDEAKQFGIHLSRINNRWTVNRAVNATEGYFITHYEFLSIIGKIEEKIDSYHVEVFEPHPNNDSAGTLIDSYDTYDPKIAFELQRHTKYIVSVKATGEYSKRFKGYSVLLKRAFDTVIVDEGVKIKTKESFRGEAVRRLQARNKLILSGSPIKNLFVDLYYLFGWLFNYQTARFPFDYEDREKFLKEFGTFEHMDTKRDEKERQPRLLPEINQISLFWKLTAPCILRRKKEDIGEALVKKNVHRIKCEFSATQYDQYKWWNNDDNFTSWFLSTHPGFDVNKMFNLKILGQLWKLRFTTGAPSSSKVSSEDTFVNTQPYTNKILTCLKLVQDILMRGEQVVIFTDLQDSATFLKQMFGTKAHVANGKTIPEKRKDIMRVFKNGTFPILIAGIEAVNLGHSLETCSNLILMDYPWEHSTTRQAIDRIHRLNSKKDVNVYMLYVAGSYEEVMLQMIDKKGMSSDLALDGRLVNQDELQLNYRQLLKESIKIFRSLKQDEFIDEALIKKECDKILKSLHTGLFSNVDIISEILKKQTNTVLVNPVPLNPKKVKTPEALSYSLFQ
jgi:SNF2 family DNA or RNA helicase/predicted RNA methylase